jgi:hypothetical protein
MRMVNRQIVSATESHRAATQKQSPGYTDKRKGTGKLHLVIAPAIILACRESDKVPEDVLFLVMQGKAVSTGVPFVFTLDKTT